ncbi:Thiol-disulfide oxidoreductase ResA [compost metagenome]
MSIEFSDKPSVLLFFTTWCPYCNDDAPKMVELYNKYKDEVNVYGINVINRDVLSEVKQYVEHYQIEYPVLLDESNQLYEKYGEKGFPSMFFVDTNGKTKDRIIGSTDISVIEESFLGLINSH